MKLRILTHAERDLRGTLPYQWPEFMAHDPIVNTFWPRLYELFPDFQFWVVDGRDTRQPDCCLPTSSRGRCSLGRSCSVAPAGLTERLLLRGLEDAEQEPISSGACLSEHRQRLGDIRA